jgi:competence protein ComEC
LAWLAHLLPLLRVSSSFIAIIVAMIGAAVLVIAPAHRARWIGLMGFIPLFFWPFGDRLQSGEVSVAMLDVGQGLAVVVRTRSHTLVYDTGPRFSTQFDTGSAVIAPYLRYSGVPFIDRLVVSHGDNDHIGGAESLIREIPVHQITTSVPARLAGYSQIVHKCWSGQRWDWDGVHFEMLSPPESRTIRGNNGSCVLHIEGRYGSVLLPGDIEREQEAWLIEQYGKGLAAQLLVAPHHGSRTSSSMDFVQSIRPRLTLFPVGYLNRYHHPDDRVVQRYQETGSDILLTPATGAVRVTFTKSGRSVHVWREENRRFWFHLP